MKIATRFVWGALSLAVFLVTQVFGQTTYTTPEAQKAAAQLSQPAGPPQQARTDTPNQQSDRTAVPGYGAGSSAAADNRPVQPIYGNSAGMGGRPMPMHDAQANPSAMAGQHDNVSINSATGQQRGEIGVWLVENGGQGVRVARLARGGAAEQAGLKSGDIITQVNGNSVSSPREASQQIRNMPVGQTANLTLMRDGKQQQLQVTLAEARQGQPYQVGYGNENENGGDRAMGGERDGNGLAARTARLEQQIASMTEELREMRQQLAGMRASSEARSASGTATQSGASSATPSDVASPTASSLTPPQAGAGTTTSSSSTAPSSTPAAGTSPTSSTSPSSTNGGNSDDLFGSGSSTSGASPAGGATK